MIRFIRDVGDYKKGMERDLGALESTFTGSGDAVSIPTPNSRSNDVAVRYDPDTGRLLSAVNGSEISPPVPGGGNAEVITITATDAGSEWATAPALLSFSASLTSGGATTVLIEARDAGGTVATVATITCDTVAEVLRQAVLMRQQSEYRVRRSSGTGNVSVTI